MGRRSLTSIGQLLTSYAFGQPSRERKAAPTPKPAHQPRKRSAFELAVDGLTNWQRHQWARAGYPGLRQQDARHIERFARMTRRAAQPSPLTTGETR